MGKSTADTAGGATALGIVGAMLGGPFGALAGAAIGGLIGGKNIMNVVVGAIEKRSGELSRNSRIPEDKREKFAEMHDRLKEQRERNRH
ncbi:MAG: hypothetical protein IJ697_04025 [Synergistaceae bacterium]|nr:hypothetical protein [Synergistaceae bacterium]